MRQTISNKSKKFDFKDALSRGQLEQIYMHFYGDDEALHSAEKDTLFFNKLSEFKLSSKDSTRGEKYIVCRTDDKDHCFTINVDDKECEFDKLWLYKYVDKEAVIMLEVFNRMGNTYHKVAEKEYAHEQFRLMLEGLRSATNNEIDTYSINDLKIINNPISKIKLLELTAEVCDLDGKSVLTLEHLLLTWIDSFSGNIQKNVHGSHPFTTYFRSYYILLKIMIYMRHASVDAQEGIFPIDLLPYTALYVIRTYLFSMNASEMATSLSEEMLIQITLLMADSLLISDTFSVFFESSGKLLDMIGEVAERLDTFASENQPKSPLRDQLIEVCFALLPYDKATKEKDILTYLKNINVILAKVSWDWLYPITPFLRSLSCLRVALGRKQLKKHRLI